MKTRLIKHHNTLLITILMLLGGSSIMLAEDQLTEIRPLDSFDKIIATNGVNILLRHGAEEKVEVRISNGLLSDVSTIVTKGILKIKMRPRINKDISVIAIVYCKDINGIDINKGASFETRTVILTDKFKIEASTGANIKAEIECENLELIAGGASSVALYGWAQRFEATANTKAKINSEKLNADRVLARVATGAEIWVKPKDYLEAIANTGGTIFYTKKAEEINERVSSGGEVRNKVERIGDSLIMDKESK